SRYPRAPPSFPTRRSSDLCTQTDLFACKSPPASPGVGGHGFLSSVAFGGVGLTHISGRRAADRAPDQPLKPAHLRPRPPSLVTNPAVNGAWRPAIDHAASRVGLFVPILAPTAVPTR